MRTRRVLNRARSFVGLAALAAACGRVGFEPSAADGPPGPDSADAMVIDDPTCADPAAPPAAPFHAGDGSPGAPFLVCTPAELAAVGTTPAAWARSVRLGANLDLTGVPLSAIGNATSRFTGTFDGGGHELANAALTVGADGGLFGVTVGATVRGLVVRDLVITATSGATRVGLLVGHAYNTALIDLSIDGELRAETLPDFTLAGAVGLLEASGGSSEVTRVTANLRTTAGYDLVAGLAGAVTVTAGGAITMTRVDATVSVAVSASNNTFGGLIGILRVSAGGVFQLRDAVTRGTIDLGANGSFSGGLIGTIDAQDSLTVVDLRRVVSHVNASSPVAFTVPAALGGLIGSLGLIGAATVHLDHAFADGTLHVTSASGSGSIGGLVGGVRAGQASRIELGDCASASALVFDGSAEAVSPGFGTLDLAGNSTALLERVLVTGTVTAPDLGAVTPRGGIVGTVPNVGVAVGGDLFFDQDLHPAPPSGDMALPLAAGKTSVELRTPSTFASWPPSVWTIVDGQLPALRDLPQ